ncbi:response regulator [Candidatus Neomarinimicrobiota bacterium]
MARISVIEDNPDNRLLVRAMLGNRYDLEEYVNGPDALIGLRGNKPDLVLLDISLPQMDGPEVLQNIRADHNLRDLPVIALTAHAMAGDRERFLSQGFDEYLSKPIVDSSLLIAMIERLLHPDND